VRLSKSKRPYTTKEKVFLTLLFVIFIYLNTYIVVAVYWNSLYDEDTFNCVDMSYEIAPLFHLIGFDTKIVYGSNNKIGHCWISLNGFYFDSTVLAFHDEKEYPSIDYIDEYPYDNMMRHVPESVKENETFNNNILDTLP
jgi:hypothetical protein